MKVTRLQKMSEETNGQEVQKVKGKKKKSIGFAIFEGHQKGFYLAEFGFDFACLLLSLCL